MNLSPVRIISANKRWRVGTILLGIDDTGAVIGIDDSRHWEEWIANIARQNIVPAINVEYTEIQVEGKRIGLIEVPKGPDKHYQTSKNFYYIRIGSTSRAATQGELMRMFQQAGMFHYDQIPVEKTSIKDLNLTPSFEETGEEFQVTLPLS
ncbi:MAG: ATP-binding protein [Desulfobacula sp.]|nr:ATP-binding protein [Desulfobacula sp.]